MRAVGIGGPFGVDLVVDRDERGLPAHRQPDIGGGQTLVHAIAQSRDVVPRGAGVRQGDPGIFVHPRDGVGELENRLRHAGGTRDGRGGHRVGGGGQRDVPFAGEQTRGRIQTYPAGPRDVHLGPGVQVGEVGGRPRRSVKGGHVRGELNQVSRHEAGGQTEFAQD